MENRILHIMWNMELGGGAERALYQLVREQRSKGINADILLAHSGGYYAEKSKETGAVVFELHQRNNLDLSVRIKFLEILENYSSVHFHSAELGLIYLSTKSKHIKRYYTHRSGWFNYPLKKLFRYKTIGYFLRKYFNGISGNTRQGAESAEKLFNFAKDKVITTYNGIDFSLLKPKLNFDVMLNELKLDNSNKVIIGTSANLRDWKRIDLLIKSCEKLKSKNIHCLIIGDGENKNELQKLCDTLGLNDIITFTGRTDCVGNYLQLLDIFVQPSGPEESFGNSVVEAMGFGIASIIMEDGGGMLEHIENGVSGYVAKDLNNLIDCIKNLIDDAELRVKIAESGKERVHQKYSLSGLVDRYSKLYNIK
ncbi:MAG: glycosyltransferase family 4 protein [Chlorobiota bacterium]|nr:glycosyltransferase family 4 protein [Chlorobiota bacterium]QQS66416.1 MAG: glycosyltransferase family 4 protein [Chlorobiota bacterium]